MFEMVLVKEKDYSELKTVKTKMGKYNIILKNKIITIHI